MLFAYKKAYLALFAMSALFSLLMPNKVNARDSLTEAKSSLTASSDSFCETYNIDMPGMIRYESQAKFTSYNINSKVVYAIRTPLIQTVNKNKAVYASPKQNIVSPVEITEAKQPETIQVEVKAEKIEPVSPELNADTLLGFINEHRVKIGLSALQKDDNLMQIARERTPELFDEIFVNGNMHAGFYSRNLPYRATENIIYNQTEAGAFNWWLNSGIHRSAIQNPEYTYTGIACAGKACSQIFTSFQAK